MEIPEDLQQDYGLVMGAILDPRGIERNIENQRVFGKLREYIERIAKLESDNKRLRTALNNCSLELHYIHEHGKVSGPWKPQFLEIADILLSN